MIQAPGLPRHLETNVTIRPVDLPELRADLIESNLHPRLKPVWEDALALMGVQSSQKLALVMATGFSMAARCAELYHVSSDMCRLAFTAAQSINHFVPRQEDAPSHSGLMVFEDALPVGIGFDDGETITARGMLWTFWQGTFQFLPLAEQNDQLRLPIPGSVLPFPHGWFTAPSTVSSFAGWEQLEGTAQTALPIMLATWLLMQQSLARCTDIEPDRATRKRLRRAGQDVKPVRVIELRRPAYNGSGNGPREFHHQWIVRGHWRQQWYPSRQVHRPVWIAPHIKGPEGAPLLGGEKVYAWKR